MRFWSIFSFFTFLTLIGERTEKSLFLSEEFNGKRNYQTVVNSTNCSSSKCHIFIIIFEKIPCYIWMKGIRNLSETPYRMRRCSRSIRHVHFNAVLYVCCDALQHTLVNVAPMCEWENSIQRLRGTYIYDTNTCTPTAHSIYTYTSLWQRSYLFIWNNVFNSRVAVFYFFSISFVVCRIRFSGFCFVLYCIFMYTNRVRSFVRSSFA